MVFLLFGAFACNSPKIVNATSTVFFQQDGSLLVITPSGQVNRWNAQGSSSQNVATKADQVYFTQILSDQKHIGVVEEERSRLIDIELKEQTRTFPRGGKDMRGLTLLSNGHLLLMNRQGFLEEWQEDKKVRELTLSWDREQPQVMLGVFSPDGRLLVTVTEGDSVARVWDYKTGALVVALTGVVSHKGSVQTAAFSMDGKSILTGGVDGQVFLWVLGGRDAYTPFPLLLGAFPGVAVTSLALAVDQRTAVIGDSQGAVRILKAQTYEYRGGKYQRWAMWKSLYIHQGNVESVHISWDGARVASVGGDRIVRVHENKPDAVTSWPLNPKRIAFSSDGERFLTVNSSDPSVVQVWSTEALKQNLPLASNAIITITGKTTPYYVAKFSPDGTKIMGAGIQYPNRIDPRIGKVEIWSIVNPRIPSLLGNADDFINSPQGPEFFGNQFLATGLFTSANGGCKQITLWDLSSFEAPSNFKKLYQFPCVTDTSSLQFAIFSPDGTLMFPPNPALNEILMWDVSGVANKAISLLGAFPNERTPYGITIAQFSSDQNHLYTVTGAGTVQDWDIRDKKSPTLSTEWLTTQESASLVSSDLRAAIFSSGAGRMMLDRKKQHITIFDMAGQRPLFQFLPDQTEEVKEAVMSLDGRYVLATVMLDGGPTPETHLFLWQVPTMKELFQLSVE